MVGKKGKKKDILITGSVAIDSVKTPFGEAKEVLGGSATYSSFAASLFSPVKVISIVGSDFPERYLKKFSGRGIDISGLKVSPGKTFRWEGCYKGCMDQAHTLSVCPENLKDTVLDIPAHYKKSGYLFLANTDPDVQMEILEKTEIEGKVLLDTMNLWIEKKPCSLRKLLAKVDIMLINENESRMFTGQLNLIAAAKDMLKMGPETVIIKKGEHGALLFHNGDIFYVPAYPLEEVSDPTGAGDSFAGGFIGYLASRENTGGASLHEAAVIGSAVASFTVEDFSTNRLESISSADVEERVCKIRSMLGF